MRKLLTMLCVLGSISAFAGTIENKVTGEQLTFNFNSESREIEVISTARQLDDKTFKLERIKDNRSNIDLFSVSRTLCTDLDRETLDIGGDGGMVASCVLVPIMNIVGAPAVAVDVLLLPVKGPIKLIQNATFKKDLKILMNSIIEADKHTKVSNQRFERIINLLN